MAIVCIVCGEFERIDCLESDFMRALSVGQIDDVAGRVRFLYASAADCERGILRGRFLAGERARVSGEDISAAMDMDTRVRRYRAAAYRRMAGAAISGGVAL